MSLSLSLSPPESPCLLFSLMPFNVSPSSSPPPPPTTSTLGPSSVCVPLIRAVTFVCSLIYFFFTTRIHLRHRHKHKSRTHSFIKTRLNKALFSSYICERCVTTSKTNPIRDQTLILGGLVVFRSQRRNKQMILTGDISFFIFRCCSFFPPLSLWNT